MTRKLYAERGSALVPAMLITMMLMIAGGAVLSTVDTQQRESRRERARESTFQLVEGVLNTQIYRLSKRWPGNIASGLPHPTACPAPTPSVDCPDTAALKQIFDNVDQGSWSAVEWATQVRDDDDPATPPVDTDGDAATPPVGVDDYFHDGLLGSGERYDKNGNDKLWVRAEATVRGRKRVVVALVKAEVIPSKVVPNESIVAGWFTTETSSRSKDFVIQPQGSVIVRCGAGETTPLPPNVSDGCAEYLAGRNGTSTVSPQRVYSKPTYGNAYEDPEAAVDGFREQAITLGNYYATGCPSLQGQHPGELVFIENLGSGCTYRGNDTYNTPSQPGSVVIARGGPLEITGTVTYYGLLYHANLQETVDNTATTKRVLLRVHGTGQVVGGLYVDGFLGGVSVGSSGRANLIHNSNAGDSLQSFGTAGIVQNSFRELRTSTGVGI